MAKVSFEKVLMKQLQDRPKLNAREKRMLRVLEDDSPGPLRKARLAAMEQVARNELGLSASEPVDWTDAKFDWKSLLAIIIPMILKFLGL